MQALPDRRPRRSRRAVAGRAVLKFGLAFDILTPRLIEDSASATSAVRAAPAAHRAHGSARAQRRPAVEQLASHEWDLIVVDEAHRMSAHCFGGELKETKRFRLGELLAERRPALPAHDRHAARRQGGRLPTLPRPARPRPLRGPCRRSVPRGRQPTGSCAAWSRRSSLTFDGTPAVPRADRGDTSPTDCRGSSSDLYEQVTDVRARWDEPAPTGSTASASNTVGFALTVLQRRLAS